MKTATPAMARAINDRLALNLMLDRGPLTAPQLRALTGLSRPTVSDLIERLTSAGLIEITGESGEARRGPNARLYGLVADRAFVAGVDLRRETVTAAVADITGREVGSVTRARRGELDVLIEDVVLTAAAGRPLETVVVGAPGLVHPQDGDLVPVSDNDGVPGWRRGVIGSVRRRLGTTVVLENEMNLAAIAEMRIGAARDSADFVLLGMDNGVGAAVVLGGRLRRGVSGGAGEIGFLEIDGVPYCELLESGRNHGLGLEELAERLAKGVVAFATILDPGLVVIGGKIGYEGGEELAAAVSERAAELSPAPVEVRASAVAGNAILQGAVLTALDLARDRVYG